MAAMERPDSNALKPRSLHRTYDVVLLLHGGDSVIAAGADVNRRVKKACARANFRVSIAQVVFVGTGNVDSGHAATPLCKQRRDVTNALSASGEASTCDRPLFRSGKAATQSLDGGQRHCATPGRGVAARMLRPVSGQQHPAFSNANSAIKISEIISILTFEIAGGTNHQHGPARSRIEIAGCRQHSNCIRRYDISSLRSEEHTSELQSPDHLVCRLLLE